MGITKSGTVASRVHRYEGVKKVSKQLALSFYLFRMAKWIGTSRKRINVFVICLLAGAVVGIYINSLGNDFVNWDDLGNILMNGEIRSLEWSNIKGIFSLRRASTYQPIRVLSYAVDYHFWKLNPVGYHITNITLYLLKCVKIIFTTDD